MTPPRHSYSTIPGSGSTPPHPKHLLAMKVLAGRRRDAEDIRLLANHLGLTTAPEVRAVCVDVFSDEPIPRRSELLLDELFGTPSPTP